MFEPSRRFLLPILRFIRGATERLRSKLGTRRSVGAIAGGTSRTPLRRIAGKANSLYSRIEAALADRLRVKNGTATVFGRKMALDVNDSLALSVWGIYDPQLTEYIRTSVKRGCVAVDIGANIGYFTVILSDCVGKTGVVHAFEPDDDNFSKLKTNVEGNRLANVKLVNKALANSSKRITLYRCEENAGMHSVWPRQSDSKGHEVEAMTLDDYFCRPDDVIDFLKMDIEGAEYGVLEGASRVVSRSANLVMVTEFCPAWIRGYGKDPLQFLLLLHDLGFFLYDMNRGFEPVPEDRFGALLSSYDGSSANMLCAKEWPLF